MILRPFRLLGLLAVAWLVLASSQALAAGPKRTGVVTLNCPVVGATVTVDGEEVGIVPLDPFELKAGAHTIRVVRAGLIAFEQQVTVNLGDNLRVVAVAKEARSLLTINTTEKGGEVLIDGKVVGALPVRELTVSPGDHSLFVRKDGLQPFKETFTVQPFREYVSNPALRRRDGSMVAAAPAGLGLGLDLDLDLPAAPAPKGKPAAASLDLDLEDFAPAAPARPDAKGKPDPKGKPAPAAVANNDLDLDFDFPAPVAAAPPVKVAVNTPAPVPVKVAANTPAPVVTPAGTKLPQAATKPPLVATKPLPPAVKPRPVEVAARTPPAPKTFVTDPVAKAAVEEEEEIEYYDPTPLYKKKWVWATLGVAAVAAVVVPIAMGKTGGYIEQQNAGVACRDCLVVMNGAK